MQCTYPSIVWRQAALDKAAAAEREIIALPEHPGLRAHRESAQDAASAAVAAASAEANSGNNGAASPAGAPSTPTVCGNERVDRQVPLQSVAERPSCEGAPRGLKEQSGLSDPRPNEVSDEGRQGPNHRDRTPCTDGSEVHEELLQSHTKHV